MPSPILRLFAAVLVAAVPTFSLADGAGAVKTPHASEAPTPRGVERGECVPGGALAEVASVVGDVRLQAADGSSRALDCDDVVGACEDIVTGPGASASLLIDGAVLQIGPDSQLELSARPAPEVALERGAVRVVDARDTAAQRVQIFTPGLTASTGRGDTEITRVGDRVRVCALDEPVVVMARDGAETIAAGRCAETSVLGSLSGSAAGAPQVALGTAESCPFHVAGLPGLVPPVSAPPQDGPGIDPFDPPGRDACDDPGSGCGAVRFDDPDPGSGCGFPGSPCGGQD